MDRLRNILDAHPDPASSAGEEALQCIYEAAQCALVCTTCADACLIESGDTPLTRCIRLNLDCAEACWLVARLLSPAGARDRDTLQRALETCIRACRACADECDRHAETMEHCAICAEACRACLDACTRMEAALVP